MTVSDKYLVWCLTDSECDMHPVSQREERDLRPAYLQMHLRVNVKIFKKCQFESHKALYVAA